jgi:hypothetical protein
MRLLAATILLAAVSACGGSELPDSTATVKWMAGPSAAAKAGSTPNNLVDHGGTVLTASTTVALYWGPQADFPSDLQAGMTSLLQGFNGSAYLGIARQYMRGSGISSSYGGPLFDSSAPP